MPNINIKEVDLTSPGSLNLSANVVYVPGAAKDYVPTKYKAGVPILYEKLSTFIEDWGRYPAKFSVNGSNDIQYDTGYIYAAELLRLGTPVLYDCGIAVNTDTKYNLDSDGNLVQAEDGKYYQPNYDYNYTNTFNALKEYLAEHYLAYCDKGLFDIKFVSNGGYTDLNASIFEIAKTRQDCVALLDPWEHISVQTLIDSLDSLTNVGIPTLSNFGQYAAIFTPCAIYSPSCVIGYKKDPTTTPQQFYPELVRLPGSFGYLMALASSTNLGSQNWLAMAGASRGQIPNIVSLVEEITTAQIDELQMRDKVSINPIATINPFGIIIWGNRTAYNNAIKGNLVASSFLNIRNLVSEIKKTVWVASRQLTFEQNSDILWVNFKSLITPTLDKMVTGGGLSGYELLKRTAKQKATLSAVIRLYAIEAVEDFDIEIQLADESTAIIE